MLSASEGRGAVQGGADDEVPSNSTPSIAPPQQSAQDSALDEYFPPPTIAFVTTPSGDTRRQDNLLSEPAARTLSTSIPPWSPSSVLKSRTRPSRAKTLGSSVKFLVPDEVTDIPGAKGLSYHDIT